jgi:NADH pyrophosphatase NudC (nudix superfamily)
VALGDSLTIDITELDDARWFSRAEVEAALAGDAGRRFPAAAALRHRADPARALGRAA